MYTNSSTVNDHLKKKHQHSTCPATHTHVGIPYSKQGQKGNKKRLQQSEKSVDGMHKKKKKKKGGKMTT
jgi:hypothetical protein